jgi:hypothetical protein
MDKQTWENHEQSMLCEQERTEETELSTEFLVSATLFSPLTYVQYSSLGRIKETLESAIRNCERIFNDEASFIAVDRRLRAWIPFFTRFERGAT